MRGRVALLAVVLAAACGDQGRPIVREPLGPLAIQVDAEWVRDDRGRVVVLRGLNYSALEFGNFVGGDRGPRETDFDQIASWGLNSVRLAIAWSYLEPQPGQLDEGYLNDQVDIVVGWAADRGLVVVLDMHQYSWSRCFTNGNGAPAWVCDGRGYSDDVTGVEAAACDFWSGATAPDGRELRAHFTDAWRLVAGHYAADARVVGFDFFNEPMGACPGVAAFEDQVLVPFYEDLRATVTAEGARQVFFYTPPMVRNIGLPAVTRSMAPGVVYAPHLYTQTGGLPDVRYLGDASLVARDYDQAVTEAQRLGGPLFAAEFGGNTSADDGYREATTQFLTDSLDAQDARLVGGAVWAYFPGDNTFSIVDATRAEKAPLVDAVVRPFARRIAGRPTRTAFDADSGTYTLEFVDEDGPDVPDPSELFVPARRYPGGFTVTTSGKDAFEIAPDGSQVLVYRGGRGTHEVQVSPVVH